MGCLSEGMLLVSTFLLDCEWKGSLVKLSVAKLELICRLQTVLLVSSAATRSNIGLIGKGKTLRN